jgi:hypothetical protein
MKKLIRIAAIISALVLVPVVPAFAETWSPPTQGVSAGSALVTITESDDFMKNSDRQARRQLESGYTEAYLCPDGLGAGACDFPNNNFQFQARSLMPVCAAPETENCISTLVVSETGKDSEAKFVGYAGGPKYAANDALNLREGSQISLWEKADGARFAVKVIDLQIFQRNTGKFWSTHLEASVVPYKLETGPAYRAPTVSEFKNPASGLSDVKLNAGDSKCFWLDESKCGVRQDFAPDTKISLTLHLSKAIAGWFGGRLKSPDIAVKSMSAKNNEVKVSASTVDVARFAVIANSSNTSDEAFAALTRNGGTKANVFDNRREFSETANAGFISAPFTYLSEYRSATKDTSAGVSTHWNFQTIKGGVGGSSCLEGSTGLIGMVTTNATVYDGKIPKFEGGQLTYRVGSLHYLPDGKTPFEGMYDLVMDSKAARCLYGFTSAPLAATISVVGGDGESKVATTVVSEKNGWLKLAAYGFTFSSPTISVKLSQAKAPAKKTTITCVKGKLTKKVTAVGPKCPAGYKKK